MPPVGFEPAIPASERPQTPALERAATGIGPECNPEVNTWYVTSVEHAAL